ncbi:MAG: hypothetical protein H6813_02950 [Phycisphaeraceae bacterium]|nr:hypothetical protein [Phycisphaeraceae bacterium]MCB9848725.1 hypothetical protein [Phycisphaeraceae bacterium]
MLSMPRLVRLAESGQYDRLLEEVLRNGRPLPLAARLRLSNPGMIEASAISLALSRVTELTHRPTSGALDLALRLLDRQLDDGSFGSPAVTASAVEAIIALLEQDRFVIPGLEPDLRDRLETARDRAFHALYSAHEAGAANTRQSGLLVDALETALTLWRLGERAIFDAVVGIAGLRRALAEAQARSLSPEVEMILALSPASQHAPIAA